jgi:hypothetical protein
MTRLYPQSVANPYVPKDVFLVADVSLTSGEMHFTYYIDKEGYLFMVCDWIGSKPQQSYMFELTRLTGDTEQMIEFRWKQFAELI